MLLAFSDGCCPRIDSYYKGEKDQGSFIIQAEKVNEKCYYLKEERGLWMCEDSWWAGELSDKGQCKGIVHASTDSKPNIHVQDNSLQWKLVDDGYDVDLKFKCVDVSLHMNSYKKVLKK